jgi:hypothetical protein
MSRVVVALLSDGAAPTGMTSAAVKSTATMKGMKNFHVRIGNSFEMVDIDHRRKRTRNPLAVSFL